MLTIPVEQWIGNAAAVLSGTWGAITRRSEQSGYSRTAIYTHATRVVQAVANEQAGGLSYEELWAEYERLRAENQDLWQAWAEAEELSEAKQREVAASGSAMGLSLTQVVTVLAIVLPWGVVPSRATVGRWVQQAAGQGPSLSGASPGVVSRRNLLASRAHCDGDRTGQPGVGGGAAGPGSQRGELAPGAGELAVLGARHCRWGHGT